MEQINNRELTEKLLVDWLGKLEYLNDEKRKQLYKIGCAYYGNNISFLYKINTTIYEKKSTCKDILNELIYTNEEDKHILTYKENKMEFTYEQIREIVFGLIDILEKIYPLGTVVELKKEYLEKIIQNKDIESVQVVIVSRFNFHNDVKTFFQYAGVVYPMGLMGDQKVIQFTSALVDKVLKKGYSDSKEEAYIYLMKNELIVEKGMHSFGFSTEEERKSLEEKARLENV